MEFIYLLSLIHDELNGKTNPPARNDRDLRNYRRLSIGLLLIVRLGTSSTIITG
jgi:hypothetical protein